MHRLKDKKFNIAAKEQEGKESAKTRTDNVYSLSLSLASFILYVDSPHTVFRVGRGTQTLKLESDTQSAPSWTSSTHPVELINHSNPLPLRIFPGSMCNRGEALAFDG